MTFRIHVEPPEPMRGLEVPEKLVDALGEGKRPWVTVTIKRAYVEDQHRHHAGAFTARSQ